MQLSTLELVGLGFVFVMFGMAGFFTAVLLFPKLGERLLRRRFPNEPPTPAQQRAARLSLLCSVGICFAFGVNFLARTLAPFTCTGQNVLQATSTIALISVAVISLINIRFAAQLQKALSVQPKKPNPVLTIVLIFGILALTLGLPYLLLRHRLNQPFETLDQIEMVSETEGWALGNSSFTGIMYHYEDGTWQREAIPPIRSLTGLSMTSPDAGWAVSDSDQMLHYQQGSWSIKQAPVDEIYAIDMVSDAEGWAVGNFGNILHYSGSEWRQVQSPTDKSLHGVAMMSATDGWVVGGGGYASGSSSVILRYQEGEWREFPNPTTLPLLSVHAVSSDEAWAVGGTRFPNPQSVILHFRRGEWVVAPSPAQIPLSDVSVSPTGEGWAVGGGFFPAPLQCEGSRETVKTTTLLRYTNQTWTEFRSYRDVALHGVSMLDANKGWMVGWNTLWKYDGGTWEEFQTVP